MIVDTDAMALPMRSAPAARVKQAVVNNITVGSRFAAATAEHGGATMNARTGHLYEGGEQAHMVGGHPNALTGGAIPTHYYDAGNPQPHITAAQAHQERLRVFASTAGGRGNAGVGSWIDSKNPTKGVQLDATTVFHNRRGAEDATLSRNEDAYFSMHDFSEPRNEGIRQARGLGPRPAKTD